MQNSTIPTLSILIALLLTSFPAISTAWGEAEVLKHPAGTHGDVQFASMEAKRHMEGGHKLEREKNLPGAIALYSKAATLAPTSAEAHFALGEALAKSERFQEALVRYTLAVTIAPNHVKARYGRSQLCLRMALYAQACKDLSQLIDLIPGVADYHYQRATTLMKLKNITEAYHDFLRAHELDKKYPRPSLIWKNNFVATKSV